MFYYILISNAKNKTGRLSNVRKDESGVEAFKKSP